MGKFITNLVSGMAKSFAMSKVSNIGKNKRIEDKSPSQRQQLARDFIDPPASQQTIDVEAQTIGRETIGDIPQPITQVPQLDETPSMGTGIDGIVGEIDRLNRNLMAIRDAMMKSSELESLYRKDVEEDLQQAIADRDKNRSKARSQKRRDSLNKKGGFLNDLMKKPQTAAKAAGAGLGGAALLELLAFLMDTNNQRNTSTNAVDTNIDKIGAEETGELLNQQENKKNEEGNWISNFFRNYIMGEKFEYNEQRNRLNNQNPKNQIRYGFFGSLPENYEDENENEISSINSSTQNNTISNQSISGDTNNSNASFNIANASEIVQGVKDITESISPVKGDITVIDTRTKNAIDNALAMKSGSTGGNTIPDGNPSRSIVWESFQRTA